MEISLQLGGAVQRLPRWEKSGGKKAACSPTSMRGNGRFNRWFDRLSSPRRPEGLAWFRALFGALLLFSTIRFVAYGWIDQLLLNPAYHFTYAGFDWVRPLPRGSMYALFAVMGLCSIGVCVGVFARASAAGFFLCFTYIELVDKTTYLNHYYFISLMTLLLVFFGGDQAFCLDKSRKRDTVPFLYYFVLRSQIAVVYFFAGLAKLNADWLLRAEPLSTWLAARQHIWTHLADPRVAYCMSWAGAVFDLTIVVFLLWKRTRPIAYLAVIVFHVVTWILFPIGVFPWVMIVATTLFFSPDWPIRTFSKLRWCHATNQENPRASLPPWLVALCLSFLFVQASVPLRHLFYPGQVNWNERGFRFAWRVMLIEKTGMVEYDVMTSNGKKFREYPRRYLTPLQYRMLSTQPDMIAQFARHLARQYERAGYRNVDVRARSWAALNGRPSQPLVDAAVNLATQTNPAEFIIPLKEQGTTH